MPLMSLFALAGPGNRNAHEVTCDFCKATFPHTHEEDCSQHPDGDGGRDCFCNNTNTTIRVNGMTILIDCPNGCDKTIMGLIEGLLPKIAEYYPEAIRERVKKLNKVADGLGACVVKEE